MKTKLLLLLLLLLFIPSTALSQEHTTMMTVQDNLNLIWMVIAGCLVFLMQAGFALLETGLTRAKNAVNIIMKNIMDVSAGSLAFFILGFGLMFGSTSTGLFGQNGFFLLETGSYSMEWTYAFFFFQAVFAATAATIVSGAVAERTSFSAYLLFSILITGIIYPVFGSWAWGGLYNGSGWLENLGFIDFAGSTVVHSVGGWAALAGVMVIGPRVGKYKNGKPQSIKGHSLPLAALGVFILWFGWFGFNAGSTTVGDASVAIILINTLLSGGAGATAAMIVTWIKDGKPDGGMTLNGVLAGLVGITAGCANLTPFFALCAGATAGIIMYYAVHFIEKYVDDAVGAIAVHGVCGAWGTLAAGLFNAAGFSLEIVAVQILGITAAFLWTFPVSYFVFKLIDVMIPLRVNGKLEAMGLDIHEHDARAYPEFGSQMASETLGIEVVNQK